VAGFVSKKLTYLSEDRAQRIEVWDLHDGPIPRWILARGTTAHLLSSGEVGGVPRLGDLMFVPLDEVDIEVLSYIRAELWWQDGISPWIPDMVEANRLREQFETFEDMRASIERVLEAEARAGGKFLKVVE
jgi:hypothetical protein